MKRLALLALILIGASSLFAQDEMPAASNMPKYPDMQYKVVKDFFNIPSDMPMAEAVGVSVNSKGHIFILNRGNYPLLEFDNEGKFISVFGGGSPLFHTPHSIRFDSEDNLWYVNSGDNLVVKFDPKRRVEQALGRREEPWVYLTHGIERAIPAPSSFYQPTFQRRNVNLQPPRKSVEGYIPAGPPVHLEYSVESPSFLKTIEPF